MKIRLTFKDPDVLYEGDLERQVRAGLPEGLSEEEVELLQEKREDATRDLISRRWMEHGEYLTVEVDTEAETIRVVGRGEKP